MQLVNQLFQYIVEEVVMALEMEEVEEEETVVVVVVAIPPNNHQKYNPLQKVTNKTNQAC